MYNDSHYEYYSCSRCLTRLTTWPASHKTIDRAVAPGHLVNYSYTVLDRPRTDDLFLFRR